MSAPDAARADCLAYCRHLHCRQERKLTGSAGERQVVIPSSAMLRCLSRAGLVLCIAACSDVQTTRYDTVVDARQDCLFERGWIPDVLPASAVSIIETHNIDTNERCAQASVPAPSRPQVESALRTMGFREIETHPAAPPFEACTFDAPSPTTIDVGFSRSATSGAGLAATSETEYVVLAGETLYFWSAGPHGE